MKKLFITMGCCAAIVLMSSCTADSPVDSSKQNLKIPGKETILSTSATAPIDDKDINIKP